ncbi:Six-hairpin glycosidase-like protein [Thamnocephalis sphaerospora]|uniref:glucan 1,4-alpha-glucosidase n=1 Tax=Thamnocephalis sphaerospora TaxID=78915 RepID=A0A4P9XXR9_9FUNG|nr:Six-hairpin glycosidase-like protein [Thamnocephalis sphaerospora]|eukprot:RKP10852.1 Six-hairpin glycosidase-like protein [Thamnocephalis sphaerospora]
MSRNGAIYASPSRNDPDYYYFWTRDGALTMDALAPYLKSDPATYEDMFERFTNFTIKIQATPNPSNGVGEPKFNMDGSAFTGHWGRPQNDGPAIRAFALSRYAEYLRAKDPSKDLSYLYKASLPAQSPIKTDLEYVSHRWGDSSFEIWEEVKGHHFYTRLVQYKAMVDGAKLAASLQDQGAADWYNKQAFMIHRSLNDFWDSNRKLIVCTVGRDGGLDYKTSNLDNQVLLAALHAGGDQPGTFAPWDDRVLATIKALVDTFRPAYTINAQRPDLPPAIGRYIEDTYDGHGNSRGNPWILNTAAHAEAQFRVRTHFARTGLITINDLNRDFFNWVLADSGVANGLQVSNGQVLRKGDANFATVLNALLAQGDRFIERIRAHTPSDGNLYEQWNRETAASQGAPHLTWSYSSFATAYTAGEETRAIKV